MSGHEYPMCGVPRRRWWPSVVAPGVLAIPLTLGRKALIDEGSLRLIDDRAWLCHVSDGGRQFYAMSRGGVYMHRVILAPAEHLYVDHINGDGLDNRRANLREATFRQNGANQRVVRGTSRYKGVSRHPRDLRWQASIRFDGKKKYLGLFECEEDAARAYDAAAVINSGPFAATNETLGLYLAQREARARCERNARGRVGLS